MLKKFRFWCQKVLPLTYDDSLSYYEVLCKMTNKINEIIEWVQEGIGENIIEAIKEIIKDLNIGYNPTTETLNIDYDDGVPLESDQEIAAINASGTRRMIKDAAAREELSELSAVVENTFNTINNDLMTYLVENGIYTSATREIHVQASGGMDFTSLVDAVNSVTAGESTIIYLHEGAYDVSGAGGLGLTLPDKCYIVGIGDYWNIHIVAYLASANPYFSPINYTKNCGLINVWVTADKCRYVIHDDADVQNEHNRRITKHCILEGSNLTHNYAYGAGIKGGATCIIEECSIISHNDYEAISFHNMTNAFDTAYIDIHDCSLNAGRNTYGSTIRLAAVMDYEGSTVTKPVVCNIKDITNCGITFDLEYGNGNPFYVYSNGVSKYRAINGQIINWGQIFNPDIMCKPYPYNDTIAAQLIPGTPVFFANGETTVSHLTSLPVSLVQGVVVTGAPNAQTNVLVVTKGYVAFSTISGGITGSFHPGYWVNVVEDANHKSVLEISATRGNAVGFCDNTNQIYFDFSLR